MNSPAHRSLPRGFTLIELLTVIAIIGILAAIIIPVVGKVRRQAQTTKTTSNLRQLQLANLAHAADNKGFFVSNWPTGQAFAEGWWGATSFLAYTGISTTGDYLVNANDEDFPEIAKVGVSVSVSGDPRKKDRNYTIVMNQTSFTHGLGGNGLTSGNGGDGWGTNYQWVPCKIHQEKVKHPSIFMVFAEGAGFGFTSYNTRNNWVADDDNALNSSGVAFRSGGEKALYVTASGAVKALTREEVADAANVNTRRVFRWWEN